MTVLFALPSSAGNFTILLIDREVDLYIFNPEHDIALAYDKPHIMVPHVAQELRMNLGFLPAFWAKDGDCVLVDDIKFALKMSAPFKRLMRDVLFVSREDLKSLPIDRVLPWGWDRRIVSELSESGVGDGILPSEEELSRIRHLSGREHTSVLLPKLREGIESETCGESFRCERLSDVEGYIAECHDIVVKAPWSSSGRGIRYVSGKCDEPKSLWIKKILLHQGYVMVEPRYNKVADFAVELYAGEDGRVEYKGVSVFHTLNGKYSGNVIGSEESKLKRLQKYIDLPFLDMLTKRVASLVESHLNGRYSGPLGVDMMVVTDPKTEKFLIHPCVEVNLRHTMGHLAISLAEKIKPFDHLMSIAHDVNYKFRIQRIDGKFVNVIYR